jgi:hypothetical protein
MEQSVLRAEPRETCQATNLEKACRTVAVEPTRKTVSNLRLHKSYGYRHLLSERVEKAKACQLLVNADQIIN